MIKKIKRKIKKHIEEVIRLKTSPKSIAQGFALGTFLAILPTFGFGILIGILLILIFKNISKISMLIAFAIWNPLVQIPIYTASYFIGNLILSDLPTYTFRFEIINQIYFFSRKFLLGNLIIAILFSIIGYFIALKISKTYQRNNPPL